MQKILSKYKLIDNILEKKLLKNDKNVKDIIMEFLGSEIYFSHMFNSTISENDIIDNCDECNNTSFFYLVVEKDTEYYCVTNLSDLDRDSLYSYCINCINNCKQCDLCNTFVYDYSSCDYCNKTLCITNYHKGGSYCLNQPISDGCGTLTKYFLNNNKYKKYCKCIDTILDDNDEEDSDIEDEIIDKLEEFNFDFEIYDNIFCGDGLTECGYPNKCFIGLMEKNLKENNQLINCKNCTNYVLTCGKCKVCHGCYEENKIHCNCGLPLFNIDGKDYCNDCGFI